MSVTPCNQGLLAELTVFSNQTNNPIPPFPVFYSVGSCGGGGGATIGSSFPLYYFPVDCSSATVPTPADNCLRIIDNSDGHISASYNSTIPANQLNVLPDPSDNENNIFPNPQERLYSWYVPLGYRMFFFSDDVRATTIKDAIAFGNYLEVGPNQIIADACLGFQPLKNGATFFTYGTIQPGNNATVPCPLQYCACGPSDALPVPAGTDCTTGPVQPKACPGVTHYARYFIVLKEADFSDLLLDICSKNKTVTYGGDPQNTLNTVWKPQSPACDDYISTLCSISDVTRSQYAELCACFTQQQALNQQYGPALEVPVCCFGQDPSGDSAKSCFNNPSSYKTADMQRNCCSYAECTTLVEGNAALQVKASPPGEIECVGQFVQFPVPPTSAAGPVPTVIFADSSSIPLYTWIVFAVALALLLLFVLVLLFV